MPLATVKKFCPSSDMAQRRKKSVIFNFLCLQQLEPSTTDCQRRN
jgi:hypothetical protein